MSVRYPIFLDYNSTTPVRPEALEAMEPCWRGVYANASSRHTPGQQAWRVAERARGQVARLVGARPHETVFTSGATEANHLALLGRFEELRRQGRAPDSIAVAVGAIEHPCVHAAGAEIRRRGGRVGLIPVTPEGIADLDFFGEGPPWDIVSLMAANHETGAVQPLREAVFRVRNRNPDVFFHTDAAQWAGRIPARWNDWGVDALSLSSHKMYGPKGIGALLLREHVDIVPLFRGSQEAGLRGGTVFTPGAAGFGAAAEWMLAEQEAEAARLAGLRERLWARLEPLGAERTVSPDLALPNTLHVRFPGFRGERVVDALDRLGVCCSSGPACASGASDASPVLRAMGFSEEACMEGVRFSLGRETTEECVDEAGARAAAWLRRAAAPAD